MPIFNMLRNTRLDLMYRNWERARVTLHAIAKSLIADGDTPYRIRRFEGATVNELIAMADCR